jgi:hypothetical protein
MAPYDAIAFTQREMFWRVFIILMVLCFVGVIGSYTEEWVMSGSKARERDAGDRGKTTRSNVARDRKIDVWDEERDVAPSKPIREQVQKMPRRLAEKGGPASKRNRVKEDHDPMDRSERDRDWDIRDGEGEEDDLEDREPRFFGRRHDPEEDFPGR